MKWGKIILAFQAIVTLVIGISFFSQVMAVEDSGVKALQFDSKGTNILGDGKVLDIVDVKNRYSIASYVLLIIGLMELIIVSRLVS